MADSVVEEPLHIFVNDPGASNDLGFFFNCSKKKTDSHVRSGSARRAKSDAT